MKRRQRPKQKEHIKIARNLRREREPKRLVTKRLRKEYENCWLWGSRVTVI